MEQFNIKRVPRDTMRRWKREAKRLGLDTSTWARQVLTRAAQEKSPGILDAVSAERVQQQEDALRDELDAVAERVDPLPLAVKVDFEGVAP